MAGKPGAPKGNQNARRGIKGLQYLEAINKALKRMDRIHKTNPEWGADEEKWQKDVKGLKALDRIAQIHVFQAALGQSDVREKLADRLDGRSRQVTEATGQVDHKHSGIQVTFKAPEPKLVKGEVIDGD